MLVISIRTLTSFFLMLTHGDLVAQLARATKTINRFLILSMHKHVFLENWAFALPWTFYDVELLALIYRFYFHKGLLFFPQNKSLLFVQPIIRCMLCVSRKSWYPSEIMISYKIFMPKIIWFIWLGKWAKPVMKKKMKIPSTKSFFLIFFTRKFPGVINATLFWSQCSTNCLPYNI